VTAKWAFTTPFCNSELTIRHSECSEEPRHPESTEQSRESSLH
jgi:hypothetical protein